MPRGTPNGDKRHTFDKTHTKRRGMTFTECSIMFWEAYSAIHLSAVAYKSGAIRASVFLSVVAKNDQTLIHCLESARLIVTESESAKRNETQIALRRMESAYGVIETLVETIVRADDDLSAWKAVCFFAFIVSAILAII